MALRERILVRAITAMVVFDRWFLTQPDGEPYPREAVIEALIDFARDGAEGPAPPKPSQRSRR